MTLKPTRKFQLEQPRELVNRFHPQPPSRLLGVSRLGYSHRQKMDTSMTLADLPTDIHYLILSHDEEKIQIKKDNEKLRTQVKMLQCLLDEARQDNNNSEMDTSSDDEETEDGVEMYQRFLSKNFTVPQLRHQLKNAGIKGYSRANKAELVERLAIHRTS